MIELVSPARFITRDAIALAEARVANARLAMAVSPACDLRQDTFAGSDDQRAEDFIRAWNGESQILWCARGGYGAGRILPLLRGRLNQGNKTLIGYSDQTYLLAHIAKNRLGKAVHGPMPIDLMAEKTEAVDRLLDCIARDDFSFGWQADGGMLREGEAQGPTIVGNLAILTRLIGTPDEPDWDGAVLLVEDVDEYLYATDRMFLQLAEAGVLGRIAGLALGSFTRNQDNAPPFGLTVAQMALHHLRGRAIPVAEGIPIGHGPTNQPIVFGARCSMLCRGDSVTIEVEG